MEKKEEYGYVYILKNDCMPGLIKIGITKRDDYTQRIKDLNRETGVPVAFVPIRVSKVLKQDCARIERALHTAFDTDRVNPKREFFRMEEYRVIAMLELLEIENMTAKATAETTKALAPQEIQAREKEEKRSLEEKKKRRPTINFYELGIQQGETLTWKDDNSIIVTIADERKVIYDGEICSLTAATIKILGIAYSIQPTPYWFYKGKRLLDIYNDKFLPSDEE